MKTHAHAKFWLETAWPEGADAFNKPRGREAEGRLQCPSSRVSLYPLLHRIPT